MNEFSSLEYWFKLIRFLDYLWNWLKKTPALNFQDPVISINSGYYSLQQVNISMLSLCEHWFNLSKSQGKTEYTKSLLRWFRGILINLEECYYIYTHTHTHYS